MLRAEDVMGESVWFTLSSQKTNKQYVPEISVTAGPFTALPPRDQEAEVGGGSRKSSQRETEEQVYG